MHEKQGGTLLQLHAMHPSAVLFYELGQQLASVTAHTRSILMLFCLEVDPECCVLSEQGSMSRNSGATHRTKLN